MRQSKAPKRKHLPTVFLSHSSGDEELVRRVRDLLRRVDVRVFAVDDLSAGENWAARVRNELTNADAVVVLLTPKAVVSDWVLQEIGAAWALQKPVIPIVTESGLLSRLPVKLRTVQTLEAKDLNTPEGGEEFLRTFRISLAKTQAAA